MTPESWQKSGIFVNWEGHRVFVRSEGHGPVLLFVHGFPTSSWDWHDIWDSFAKDHRVIALDMLGFGFSDKPVDFKYSLQQQADVIEYVLARLGVHDVKVLSHDYGDSVAQELLARYEDRVRTGWGGLRITSLCFLNGGLFPETHRPLWAQKVLASPIGALVSRLAGKRMFVSNLKSTLGAKDKLQATDFDGLWNLVVAGGGRQVMPRLIGYIQERRTFRDRWVRAMQTTRVPLGLVVGEADPISGGHMAERYRELVPNPRVAVLPGIGHYPQMEAPEVVSARAREFLASSL